MTNFHDQSAIKFDFFFVAKIWIGRGSEKKFVANFCRKIIKPMSISSIEKCALKHMKYV